MASSNNVEEQTNLNLEMDVAESGGLSTAFAWTNSKLTGVELTVAKPMAGYWMKLEVLFELLDSNRI